MEIIQNIDLHDIKFVLALILRIIITGVMIILMVDQKEV